MLWKNWKLTNYKASIKILRTRLRWHGCMMVYNLCIVIYLKFSRKKHRLLKWLQSKPFPPFFPNMFNNLTSVLTVGCLVKELAIPLQISSKYWFVPFISLAWDIMVGLKMFKSVAARQKRNDPRERQMNVQNGLLNFYFTGHLCVSWAYADWIGKDVPKCEQWTQLLRRS